MRFRPLVAALALGSVTLTGCANPLVACTDIGWINTVELQTTGDVSVVDHIRFCDDDGRCSPPPSAGVTTSGPIWAAEQTDEGYALSLDLETPDPLVVRAIDASGSVIVEQSIDLDWVRVGGSAACGGPHEATATLTLP